MKALMKGCLVVSFLLVCGGAAFAEQYNCPPGPNTCVPTEWNDSYGTIIPTKDANITFDLTQFDYFINPNPYQPGVDKITSAYLTFNVDGKSFRTNTFDLYLGTAPVTTVSYAFKASDYTDTYSLTGTLLYDLQQDGKIKVVFDGTGKYPGSLDWVWLTADGYDNCPVPEPSTLLLFGAGLIGVGILRRRTCK